ncbi:MAG: molybdate ABC transporter substrate-binding protein [Hyphomonadaceae bacterium]
MAGALAVACLAACSPDRAADEAAETAAQPVRVFAASSLTDVIEAMSEDLAASGRPAPVVNLASSSTLARQIEQGAGADVFLSADQVWMDYLQDRGMIDPLSRFDFAANSLILIAPADSACAVELPTGAGLSECLEDGRIALADPSSVPAGKYAREALETLNLWGKVVDRYVSAENVRAALLLVETGEAAAGIVYATDAAAAGDRVKVLATFDPATHTPIVYPAARITEGDERSAKPFLGYLKSDAARKILTEQGFGVPAPAH